MSFEKILLIYFIVISVVAVFLTIHDKNAAVHGKWRVPERTLMLVGLFGGALPMYIIMKLIHHKTLHKKFMLGLPAEFLLHVILLVLYYWYFK